MVSWMLFCEVHLTFCTERKSKWCQAWMLPHQRQPLGWLGDRKVNLQDERNHTWVTSQRGGIERSRKEKMVKVIFFFQRKVQPSVLLPLFDAIITLAFYHFNSFLAVCSHRWPNKPCVPLCLRWEAKHVTSRAFTVESFSFENRIS